MSQKPNCKKFNLETPATYRIRVQGSIDSTWSDMLGSMRISTDSTTGKESVTAHSMGGLVARGFILKNVYDDGNDYIKLFVSISSPFGGLEMAKKGVESAPEAIPSWHDVVPGSPYIEKIFSQPLKGKIDYYLLFSHKGDCSFFMDNNDGAVTLRSQLDLRAQKDAISKWGFDEGHVTILSSQDVLGIYNDILEKTGRSK